VIERAVAVLAGALWLTCQGCGGERAQSPAQAAGDERRGAVEVGPIATPRSEGAGNGANEAVNQALGIVAELRELPPKGPVRGQIIDRKKMLEHVRQQLHSEIPEPVVRATNEMLFLLNVVPSDFDYEKSLLVLLEAQLAGFYEPKDKTMYLLADLPAVEREATLAHELVHALQDQHYDLGSLIKFRDDATDQLSAVHALAEGDATSAMLDHMLLAQGKRAIDLPDSMIGMQTRGLVELSPSMAGVPTIVKRSVISPYVDGVDLVHWARRKGGWAAVNALWAEPPTTTEQLLHPEKLAAREPALSVAIPAAPQGSPLKVVYHDVLGEQSLRLLFEEWVPRRTAIEAARDWGGDRLAMFEGGERRALAWRIRFDGVAQAERMFEVLARGVLRDELGAAGSSAAPVVVPDVDRAAAVAASRGGKLCRERPSRGPMAAVRTGRDIALVAGPVRRTPAGARSDSDCAAARAWAAAVAVAP
jgi:hypothetical protein